jgi:hypothetical protein
VWFGGLTSDQIDQHEQITHSYPQQQDSSSFKFLDDGMDFQDQISHLMSTLEQSGLSEQYPVDIDFLEHESDEIQLPEPMFQKDVSLDGFSKSGSIQEYNVPVPQVHVEPPHLHVKSPHLPVPIPSPVPVQLSHLKVLHISHRSLTSLPCIRY